MESVSLDATFGEIVRRHGGMIYSIALRFLGDGALAEDIVQEAFFRLSGNLGRIESEAHLTLWLRRVATRLCIDEHRRFRKRFVPLDSIPEPASGAATGMASGDFLQLEQIRAIVAELPEKARMALILRFQEDMPPLEMARVLQVPLYTIKSRLKRALATLRERMGAGRNANADANIGDEQ
jgi:RNA polymerase sigma-70 factor (ECF subfamily)